MARTGERFRGLRAIRGSFHRDDGGAFLVVEAILVAVLVLTAVLFFTSVQRPQAASEARGVDLGQVATDTLGILQRRAFTNATTGDPEGWVTKVLRGDTATAELVDDFLDQVLPTGAKHTVRLSNGVGAIGLLPTASPGEPRGARAAEVPLFPHWQVYAGKNATDAVVPGQQVFSGGAFGFTQPGTTQCIRAPYPSATATVGSQVGPGNVDWTALWQGQAAGEERVPTGIPYGTWVGYPNADCSGAATYVAVVLPGVRTVGGLTWTNATNTLTAAVPSFSEGDVGRLVVGAGIPAGTTVALFTSDTVVVLSTRPSVAGTNAQLALASDPTYPMYGLQLVVWFGA